MQKAEAAENRETFTANQLCSNAVTCLYDYGTRSFLQRTQVDATVNCWHYANRPVSAGHTAHMGRKVLMYFRAETLWVPKGHLNDEIGYLTTIFSNKLWCSGACRCCS